MNNVKRRRLAILLLALTASAYPAAGDASKPWPRGHVVFAADFEGPQALKPWAGPGKVVPGGYQGGHALLIRQEKEGGSAVCRVSLPAQALRGYTLACSVRVRCEQVSPKPRPWNGIKFMAPVETPSGTQWPAADLGTGTFGWRKAAFLVRVPRDARALSLVLGLEAVTGKVWFDDVRVTVRRPPPVPRPASASRPPVPSHGLPRLRGAMVSPDVTEADLRVLGKEWKANLIRWQLIRYAPPDKPPALKDFDPWLDGQLDRLARALPWCRKYGLLVVVDLHSPPGGARTGSGYIGSDAGLFSDRAAQDKFVAAWQRIARRFKGEPVIWGFDLANEPVENAGGKGTDDWHDLALRAAQAIRKIDPRRTIIVEPSDWGEPGGLEHFEPLDLPNVVYSVHMYQPHDFTHQRLDGRGPALAYPGKIRGKYWDKKALEAALKPARDFQQAYGVPIYIGEFSVIRWAPGESGYRYLRDVIDIFEGYGWDWTYHAFREWNGWSVEHGPDRTETRPASKPTPRQLLLRKWFARNEKPRFR